MFATEGTTRLEVENVLQDVPFPGGGTLPISPVEAVGGVGVRPSVVQRGCAGGREVPGPGVLLGLFFFFFCLLKEKLGISSL